MELAVGAIIEGKVTGITKFGAFVSLPEGKSGLVHISEIANTYVNDVHDHLTEGQDVKVKVLNIDQSGKISLSIKKALDPIPRPNQQPRRSAPASPAAKTVSKEPQSFDDMVKAFMADSDSKISGIRQYSERKTRTRRK